jgi:alkylation response protein AidB-like acyl-CoA dehydrogenase
MMNFSLNDEQRMLQDSARQFAQNSYDFDRRKVALHDEAVAGSIWKHIAQLGWAAIGLPEEFGGIGDAAEIAVLSEQLGRCLYVGPFLSSTVSAGQALSACRNAEIAQDLLPAMAAGVMLVALAYREAADRGGMSPTTRAVKQPSGYVLDGCKSFVLGAMNANKLIVTARLEGSRSPLSLFLVDPASAGVNLLATRLLDGGDGADVILQSVKVGANDLLAEAGAAALARALDYSIVAVCAETVGLMSRAVDYCVEYAGVRKQFGRLLADFQALQHKIADMAIETEMMRSAMFAALAALSSTDESAKRKSLATTKIMCGQLGRWVCGQAIQFHGGIGMTEEHAVGHYFRRVNVIEASFGGGMYHQGQMKELLRSELRNAVLARAAA